MSWENVGVAPANGIDWARLLASDLPTDPGAVWAAHGGWSEWVELFKETGQALDLTRFPVLLEIGQGRTVVAFAKEVKRAKWSDVVEIPLVYAKPRPYLAKSRFCTAFVKVGFFATLAEPKSVWRDWIARYQLSAPITRRETGDFTPPAKAAKDIGEVPVVEAVIDDGLPFANASVRPGSGGPGTGIRYLWNQGDPRDTVLPNAPGFRYGTEYLAEDIARWINASGGDEEAAYLAPRQVRSRRRATHGAAVLGLVHDPALPLVCVQLPYSTSVDTSGASLGVCTLDAMRYIFARADAIAAGYGRDCGPLVVTLSYGYTAGPHDGRSIIEAAIDEMIDMRSARAPTEVVIPAGNTRMSRLHAKFDLKPGSPQTLEWRILPDDLTPSFVEIWFPEGAEAGAIHVQLQAPCVEPSGQVGSGAGRVWVAGQQVLGAIIFPKRPAGQPERAMVWIAAGPTRSFTDEPVAPCGIWTIRVSSDKPLEGVHAWVQRDDAAFGFVRRGRQSFFDDPDYQRFDDDVRSIDDRGIGLPESRDIGPSYVKRSGTLNAIATGKRPTVVGAFRESDDTTVAYSGDGDGSMRSPDVLGCAAHSVAMPNILARGTHSASLVAVSGTSFAAARIARALSGRLGQGETGFRSPTLGQSEKKGRPRTVTPRPVPTEAAQVVQR